MLASNEKEALHGIDDRISMLEKRLSNAKAARDAYVHHLRGRYPDWKPPLPSLTYPETHSHFPHHEPLLSRLATSDYQWDVDKGPKMTQNYRNLLRNPAEPTGIPLSGPLLESDLRRTKIRLREISDELRSLRMDRMSVSTEQWLQMEPFRQHKSLHLNFGTDTDAQIDYLDEANARLATIDFMHSSPVVTPTKERRMEMQMLDQHEKMVAEMRSGVLPMGGSISEVSQTIPHVVKFQEPVTVIEDTPILAPTSQPSPPPPPPTTITTPKTAQNVPNVQNSVKSLFKSAQDSDSEDSDNKFVGKPTVTAPVSTSKPATAPDISNFLSSITGNSKFDDDDSDDAMQFARRPAQNQKTAAPKSAMFANDSDSDDFFN